MNAIWGTGSEDCHSLTWLGAAAIPDAVILSLAHLKEVNVGRV
jgi:hypothetical protein